MSAHPHAWVRSLPLWSYLSDSPLEITDEEYAWLCEEATDADLEIECSALVPCLFESSLVDAESVQGYRRRYARAIGALIASRAFKIPRTGLVSGPADQACSQQCD